MGEIRDALRQLVRSEPYLDWAENHPIDANKVGLELAGRRRPASGSDFAAALIRLARLDPPVSVPQGPAPPSGGLAPLWRRDVVFTRSLSSFYGDLRDAALDAGFTVVAVHLDGTPYADANIAELRAIGVGLRSRGWGLVGWATYGQGGRGAVADGHVHARIRHELGLDGWIANGEDWAEGPHIGRSREYLEGWRSYGAPPAPLAVSCLSSTTAQWAREFDYGAWLAVPGAAIMPQVYQASDQAYTIDNMLGAMARASVPRTRLAPTFNVIDGAGPFAQYNRWAGPRSIWTGDDSSRATWDGLHRNV